MRGSPEVLDGAAAVAAPSRPATLTGAGVGHRREIIVVEYAVAVAAAAAGSGSIISITFPPGA